MIFYLIMTLIPHQGKGMLDRKIGAYSEMAKCQQHLELYNRGTDLYIDPKTKRLYTMKFECMMEIRGSL